MDWLDLTDMMNEMLLKRVKEEYDEQIKSYEKYPFKEQLDYLHTIFWYQEILYFFETHTISCQAAFALMKKPEILDYIYDNWLFNHNDTIVDYFESFMKMETSLMGMSLESEV